MSNYNNYDDIQDRHMDTMIRLAYLQKEALETEDILKEVEESDKENEQVHPDIAYQMFLDKLERETRKERKTKRLNGRRKQCHVSFSLALASYLSLGLQLRLLSQISKLYVSGLWNC